MPKKIFFSFHYADVKSFRANVVRNSWKVRGNSEKSFTDGSLWERVKRQGDHAIQNLIDHTGLKNTSVTSVLIGPETHSRRWVRYEILKSFTRGNGIFGIHLNRIRGNDGRIHAKGIDPLSRLGFKIDGDGSRIYFYELNNRRWEVNSDIPSVKNKQSNTLYFPRTFWGRNSSWGDFYRFSDFFPSYCWKSHDGYYNLPEWVDNSLEQVRSEH